MNNEMICKNCKYHYIEEISFDYPQSCCSKRNATTEEWCKCNVFEYSDRYIEQLQQENKQLKERLENVMTMTACGDKKQIKNTAQYKLEKVQQQNQELKDNWTKLKKDLELVVDYGLGDESSKWDKIYGEYAKSTLKFMQELEQGSDSNE